MKPFNRIIHQIIRRIRLIAYDKDDETSEEKGAREQADILAKRDKILIDISAVRKMCDALEATVIEEYQITSELDSD